MGWIKRIFKAKKKEVLEKREVIEEEHEEATGLICDACKMPIYGEQKSIKKAGKRYHVKPCWRNLQKMAKKEAFG